MAFSLSPLQEVLPQQTKRSLRPGTILGVHRQRYSMRPAQGIGSWQPGSICLCLSALNVKDEQVQRHVASSGAIPAITTLTNSLLESRKSLL